MKWFVKCIRNYVNFSGRARRKEYWFFVLFSVIFYLVARSMDVMLFGFYGMQPFSTVFTLFIFLPDLAAQVRRLHDTGRSGKHVLWAYLFAFVWTAALLLSGVSVMAGFLSGALTTMPKGFLALAGGGGLVVLVWGIFFLVWFCLPGTPGDNKYGPDPKAEE